MGVSKAREWVERARKYLNEVLVELEEAEAKLDECRRMLAATEAREEELELRLYKLTGKPELYDRGALNTMIEYEQFTTFAWIHVKDEVPADGKKVQVWTGDSRLVRTMYPRHEVWYKAGTGAAFGTLLSRPYWRPLPAPPREEIRYKEHRQCYKCGRKDVKLYRKAGGLLRQDEIYCRLHLPDNRDRIMPFVENSGYTSAPRAAIQDAKEADDE